MYARVRSGLPSPAFTMRTGGLMPETLTESFCERCGSRYTFESAAPKQRMRGMRVLSRGVKNFVLDDKSSFDEAMAAARMDTDRESTNAQLDAFHKTFNFCMECRQYTCPNCWNEAEGRCLGCAPLLGDVVPAAAATPFAAPVASPFASGTNSAAATNGHAPAETEAEFDPFARLSFLTAASAPAVESETVTAEPEPEAVAAETVAAEPEAAAEPETVAAEPEPEGVLAAEVEAEALLEAEPEPEVAAEAEPVAPAEPEVAAEANADAEAKLDPFARLAFVTAASSPTSEPEVAAEAEPVVASEPESLRNPRSRQSPKRTQRPSGIPSRVWPSSPPHPHRRASQRSPPRPSRSPRASPRSPQKRSRNPISMRSRAWPS